MTTAPRDITPEDLEEITRDYLTKQNRGEDYIAGYIDAQRRFGFLKPAAPAWMRNSAALFMLIPISEPQNRPTTNPQPE